MNTFLTLLFFLTLADPNQSTTDEFHAECDSTSIAESASKFYDWYLKNLTRPKENWMNKKLEIETDAYFEALSNLKVLSEVFFELENKRFSNCLDSAADITYERILECGCSVGSMVNECNFFHGFHWIVTHEIYNGFVINNIECTGTTAVVELKFYYETATERGIDEFFTSRIQLSKYDSDWLIDKIEPERRRRN